MTEQRQHLTTEDFAERPPLDREPHGGHQVERDPVEQTPADRDVAEPNLTDQERFDREPVPTDEPATHDEPSAHEQPAGYHESGYHDSGLHEPDAQEPDAHRSVHESGAQDGREAPVELSAAETTAGDAPLFTDDDAADYQAEWRALQADFVDDPREAVQRADELVAQVMQTLATTFNEHKHALEEQWQRGDEVQTEELRQALKRYRTFFDRLLSV
ncbi:hypothetical protein B0I31_10368 [Saccharothrix carnea]|uniref:Uncharacterized protein n=1 Tax=Saccharothrix carnea TaxID=1280637 RepID=A0A2P8ICX6_SACCR|nr:hypothetical protein [Saccharothrix carnea]PSL56319.1 hypothetical protein B0I31_10368 [Saccharothrix carnea]